VTMIWSTAQVHPRDRLAFWVDQLCAGCHVDCEPRRGTGFFGEATIADLGGVLQIGQGATSAQVLSRSSRQIARGDDRLYVTLLSSGRSLISQDGREVVLEAGDFVLSDRTRPYQFTSDADFSHTVLMIPRDLLARRIGPAERFTAVRVGGMSGFGGLLSPMLRNLAGQLSDMAADVQSRAAENVLDLIATALLSESGETAPISAEMTHIRIKFWIETHLTEDLSGERIAAACGVSVRHLNRLFARDGSSLMHHVWERRLARCRRDLTNPAMCHRSIGEIALAAGFKDLSHFSRAYRARYGRAAREDRALLGRDPATPAPAMRPDVE
jgi:AraC-like DNA-binding protein